MKKFLPFVFIAAIFWNCSTDLDIIDDWKEITVVYGLLDQNQDTQYVRIQKAFLGPENALAMAQQFDSINYINALNVKLMDFDANGNWYQEYPLTPVTYANKETGIFAAPNQVIYSLPTPTMLTTHTYRIVVDNTETGNHIEANTSLIKDFNVTRPIGPSVNFIKINSSTMFDVEWTGSSTARVYQVGLKLHYFQRDISGFIDTLVTSEWNLGTIETNGTNATSNQVISVDPNSFYRFLANDIPSNPIVVARQAYFVEIVVYAGGEELDTYMNVNGASNSLVQERPFYTNITPTGNGYGLFSSRMSKTKTNLLLTPLTQDTLAKGMYSCGLLFLDRNGFIATDLPPGCQ